MSQNLLVASASILRNCSNWKVIKDILICSSAERQCKCVHATAAISFDSRTALRESGGGAFWQQEEEGSDPGLHNLRPGQALPVHHLQQSQGATGASL